MEVMGSNSNTSSTDNIYSCHLPRDMNFGVSSPPSRRKGEADIGLLVACKVQLSSEVIKWKTENLRLTKELDSVTHHTDDLKGTVSKLLERTKELEERLTLAEDENLQLKHRNAAMDEEKAAIVQRISMGFDKYHSFPYSESSKSQRLSREGLKFQRSFDQPVEDYIQVSHTLLDKMNREIQEFRLLSSQYKVKDDIEQPSARVPAPSKVDLECKEPCDEELEETVGDLLSKTKSLKQVLFDQRKNLQKLMQLFTNPEEHTAVNPNENNEMQRSHHHMKMPICRANGNNEYASHTKYSGTPSKLNNSLRKEVTNTAIEATRLPPCLPETQHNLSYSNATQSQENNTEGASNSDHRICPICEKPFSDKTQKEFEEHVLNHLERESASLLDQYVVL